MYGSLTTIIMVMIWLYVCMNLLMYGAEINAYFEKDFRHAHRSVIGRNPGSGERKHTVSKDFGAGNIELREVKLPVFRNERREMTSGNEKYRKMALDRFFSLWHQ